MPFPARDHGGGTEGRSRRRARTGLTVAVAVAVGAGGCGGGGHHKSAPPPPTAPTTTAPARPSSVDLDPAASLTLGLPDAPLNWNPLAAGGTGPTDQLVAAAVLPSAFSTAADGTPVLNTDLVMSATVTKARPQTVVYQLNPKATWSDGTPITAADFAYTWKAQSGRPGFRDTGGKPFSPASTLGYSSITSVSAAAGNPERVQVVFARPYAGWRELFSPILPAQVGQAVGFDTGFRDPVSDDLSGGPFLVQSEVPGVSVTLVRNARYWGQPAGLSSITVDFTGPQAAAGGLARGQLGAAVLAVAGLPGAAQLLSELRSAGLKVAEGPSSAWEDLEYGPALPLALRQALTLAVDRSVLVTALAGSGSGVTPLGNRFFLPSEAAYVDDSGGHDLHARASAAASLLAKAGYTLSGGQLRKGTAPVDLTLAVPAADAVAKAAATSIADNLGAIGISVRTVEKSVAATWPAGVDLALVRRNGAGDPAAVPLPALVTAGAPRGASSPAAAPAPWSSLAVSQAAARLVTAAGEASTVATRDADYNELDRLLWLDATDLPLFQLPTVLAYETRYANLVNVFSPGGVGASVARWGVSNRS